MHMTVRNGARVLLLVVLATAPAAAQAYMGPGLGMGAISVALGVVASILLGIFSIVWYPVKRLVRRIRRGRRPGGPADS